MLTACVINVMTKKDVPGCFCVHSNNFLRIFVVLCRKCQSAGGQSIIALPVAAYT